MKCYFYCGSCGALWHYVDKEGTEKIKRLEVIGMIPYAIFVFALIVAGKDTRIRRMPDAGMFQCVNCGCNHNNWSICA